jgi:peptidoglycan hydrolase CwlO-like protein
MQSTISRLIQHSKKSIINRSDIKFHNTGFHRYSNNLKADTTKEDRVKTDATNTDADSKKDKLETTVESLLNDVNKLKIDVDIQLDIIKRHNARIYRLQNDMEKKSNKWITWFD